MHSYSPPSTLLASLFGLQFLRLPCRLLHELSSIRTDIFVNSVELGYPADAIDKQVVNLVEGANFNPQFLHLVRITRVVPNIYSPSN